MKPEEIKQLFLPLEIESFPTGSYYICTPAVENTDRDFLILCTSSSWETAFNLLLSLGFTQESYIENPQTSEKQVFASFRKESINFILTIDKETFIKFKIATILATKLNLIDKDKRILLFQYILYGNLPKEGSNVQTLA